MALSRASPSCVPAYVSVVFLTVPSHDVAWAVRAAPTSCTINPDLVMPVLTSELRSTSPFWTP
jgi:hypothetical protein